MPSPNARAFDAGARIERGVSGLRPRAPIDERLTYEGGESQGQYRWVCLDRLNSDGSLGADRTIEQTKVARGDAVAK